MGSCRSVSAGSDGSNGDSNCCPPSGGGYCSSHCSRSSNGGRHSGRQYGAVLQRIMVSGSYLPSPCCSTCNVGWNCLHLLSIFDFAVVVLRFAVVVFGCARISSHLTWCHCSIWLPCGGIQLYPNLFTPGMVLLRYSASP